MRGEKTAAKIAKTYRKNVEKGVEKSVKEIDSLLETLSKYQNKSGTISKSKTRSKKAQQTVKETLKELNKFKTKKSRVAFKESKNIKDTSRMLQNSSLGMSGAGAQAAAEVFIKYTAPVLPKHFMSDLIIALADVNFTGDDIMNILNYIHNSMTSQIPDEMDKFIEEDDISMFISNLSNIHVAYPKISPADAIEIADKYMLQYHFDNVDDAVERWKEDNPEKSENEEEEEE